MKAQPAKELTMNQSLPTRDFREYTDLDQLERVLDSATSRWIAHGIEDFPVPLSSVADLRLSQWVRIDPDSQRS